MKEMDIRGENTSKNTSYEYIKMTQLKATTGVIILEYE